MKVKSIYHHNDHGINSFFFATLDENNSPFWQLVTQASRRCKAKIIPPALSAFGVLLFSSYVVNEKISSNPYFILLQSISAALGLVAYQVIHNTQLRPTIPFDQGRYLFPENIVAAFEKIKLKRPKYFKKWLNEVSLDSGDEALNFIINNVMNGFCDGVIMYLIKKGVNNDFNQIKAALEIIKLNPNKAIKRQILALMSWTTRLGELSVEEGQGERSSFTKNKEKITDTLISYVYGKSGQAFCIANAPEISLLHGPKQFLKELVEIIASNNYVPLNETNYLFLNHQQNFRDLLSEDGCWNYESQETLNNSQENYIKEHTSEIDIINSISIRLHIENEDEAHALGIFIFQSNFLFVDPNLGLFECNNLEDLAHTIYLALHKAYSNFDLGNASLLIHTPIPNYTKNPDASKIG